MYYPKNQHMKVKRVHLHTQFHYRAASSLRCTTLFHYLKNVKQLKWNFDKMSMCDSEKNTYEIYLFFKIQPKY